MLILKFNLKYTEEDYINKCKDFKVKYIGYHKEKKLGTVIDFICNKHEDKGIQSVDWSHFHTYKYGCKYCSGRGKTNKDIIPLIKNKDVILISEYEGNEKPITCKCRKCGNIWTTKPKVLITNGAGCPICGKIKASLAEMKPHEQFVEELATVNPNIEIIGLYLGTHKKIKCKCKIDGAIWDGYPANLLNESAGCPMCNISKGERKMVSILNKFNLDIKQQYSIDDCVYERKLKFDAFDITNNIAFEYNGEQHYYPVDFANNGYEWAMNQFELTKARDAVKIKYCNKNKIPIIIVPYWKKDNMESFLIEKLKYVGGEIKINNKV